MNDTPPEIQKIQTEIWLKKTVGERLTICFELMEFGRAIIAGNIRKEVPHISEIDLKVELFKRSYPDSFEPEELERIIAWMRERHLKS